MVRPLLAAVRHCTRHRRLHCLFGAVSCMGERDNRFTSLADDWTTPLHVRRGVCVRCDGIGVSCRGYTAKAVPLLSTGAFDLGHLLRGDAATFIFDANLNQVISEAGESCLLFVCKGVGPRGVENGIIRRMKRERDATCLKT